MKIATILGTRPEIIKLSPLLPLLDAEFEHCLIHTGQHYDYNLDQVFFEELKLPKPEYALDIGSYSPGKQTALMLEKIEAVLLETKPNLVIVQGDTNTTLAGSLAAAKLHIPIMHVESGCRSFNRRMPEEINRVLADHAATYLIAPDEKSAANLTREGIPAEKIFPYGSTVFDAVSRNKDLASRRALDTFAIRRGQFVLVTIHRAENTENPTVLAALLKALNALAEKATLVFPIHPRTRKIMEKNNFTLNKKIKAIEPQPYLTFLDLLINCRFCMSDSGGIQEEALACNVPCLILRNETEWARIVDAGKNVVVGTASAGIISTATSFLENEAQLQKIKNIPYSGDGGATQKIFDLIRLIQKVPA